MSEKQLRKLVITPQDDGGHMVSHHFEDEVSDGGRVTRRSDPRRIKFKKGDGYEMLAHTANVLQVPEPQEGE